MRIFISIVSHHHHDVMINLGTIKALSKYDQITVVCCDNEPIGKLRKYCKKYGAHYIANDKEQGFSSNNNANYLYCKFELGMEEDDYFILLNPDVFLTNSNILKLIETLKVGNIELGIPNLFLDREEMVQDDNIRLYPAFTNFVKTYLFNDRSTMVNRKKGLSSSEAYWGSGAFMILKANIYNELNGLDERYYMYCEDIDLSFRANKAGFKFQYLEGIKAVHFRQCSSKKFLSKYFFWHVQSVFKYSLFNKRNTTLHSRLEYQNRYKKND
ncbi:hypothetical protein [Psychromonas aquatilis]|uniref:GT2 family glycosyltransferase n=1 Tax=Psychromonas aquatilis TaxID=2005072 RepID=A0ABU9GTR7_9GAMM